MISKTMTLKQVISTLIASLLLIFTFAAYSSPRLVLAKQILVDSTIEKQIIEAPIIAKRSLNHVKSNIDRQIDQAVFRNDTTAEDNLNKIKASLNRTLSSIDKVIVPQQIINSLTLEISNTLTFKQMQQIDSWLKSPLGRRITEAEYHTQVDAANNSYEFLLHPQSGRLPSKRLALYKAMDDYLGLSNTSYQISLSVATSSIKLFHSDKTITAKQMELIKDELKKRSLGMTLNTMAFTYKDFSDANLKNYISTLASPAGRTFSNIIQKQNISMVSKATELMIGDISRA